MSEDSFFVYILHSAAHDRYYIGASRDPRKRVEFHNTLEKGFTARYRPWILVWSRECPSKEDALRLERKIKSWKSKKLTQEIVEGKRSL
jgi:putative endonuclease